MPSAKTSQDLDQRAALVERFEPADMDIPSGAARIRLSSSDGRTTDALVEGGVARLVPVSSVEPDAELEADSATWAEIASDVRAGMAAYRHGKLKITKSLHLGVGFLAATSGDTDPARLRFQRVSTPDHDLAYLAAGEGTPLICIHGLGGTKASFLPTVSALAPAGFRVICVDLPGFGDSHKPHSGRYDAPWFAEAISQFMDALDIEHANFAGNSMGGRIAIELGLTCPERTDRLVLLSPALAWLRDRGWKWLLRVPLPELGYIQPTPRWAVEPIVRRLVPGASDGWTRSGVDEFLRAYLTPNGRYAFYESARKIYMDEPHGEKGLWTRLAGMSRDTMFVWGRKDTLVPISFMRHVQETLPSAKHLELDCGHVPQVEMPGPTHREMEKFLRA